MFLERGPRLQAEAIFPWGVQAGFGRILRQRTCKAFVSKTLRLRARQAKRHPDGVLLLNRQTVGGKIQVGAKLAMSMADLARALSDDWVGQADGLNCEDIESDFKGTARNNTCGKPQLRAGIEAACHSVSPLAENSCAKIQGELQSEIVPKKYQDFSSMLLWA